MKDICQHGSRVYYPRCEKCELQDRIDFLTSELEKRDALLAEAKKLIEMGRHCPYRVPRFLADLAALGKE